MHVDECCPQIGDVGFTVAWSARMYGTGFVFARPHLLVYVHQFSLSLSANLVAYGSHGGMTYMCSEHKHDKYNASTEPTGREPMIFM